MPYGTANSSSCFQRAIDICLSGLKYKDLANFLDDILVFGKTWDIHMKRLKTVLTRLREYNFTLRADKCSFAMEKVVFLGYLISSSGIEPAPSLIKAIQEYPLPNSVTSVRSFLGLVGFFRKYVENFSRIGKPLFDLTHKDIEFNRGSKENNAFLLLKNKLSEKPVLCHFNEKLITELRTDASLIGLGAVLVQKYEKGFKPVGYFYLNGSNRW